MRSRHRQAVVSLAAAVFLATFNAACGESDGAPADAAPVLRAPTDAVPALRSEYDQLNVSDAQLFQAGGALRGAPIGVARYEGKGNGYARGVRRVRWTTGERVRYGIDLFLPEGFHRSVRGQVDVMRWDNWPRRRARADWGGVSIWGRDRRARLLRFRRGAAEDVLVGPFELPEGRWFRLTVVQRLGDVRGASEVFIDGRRVGRSLEPNTYGRPIQRIRFGLVAIDQVNQRSPLQLRFAHPYSRSERPSVSQAR